jgi:hypothetical protein
MLDFTLAADVQAMKFEICSTRKDMEAAYALAVDAALELGTLIPIKLIYEKRFTDQEMTVGKLGRIVVAMAIWHLDGDVIRHTYAVVHPSYRRKRICRMMRVWSSAHWKSLGAITHESMVPVDIAWRQTELEGFGSVFVEDRLNGNTQFRVYRRTL